MKSTCTVTSINCSSSVSTWETLSTDHIHLSAPSYLPQNWVNSHSAPLLWANDGTRAERRPRRNRSQHFSQLSVNWEFLLGTQVWIQIVNAFPAHYCGVCHLRGGFTQPVKHRVGTHCFKHRTDAGWGDSTGVLQIYSLCKVQLTFTPQWKLGMKFH